jgi:2-polyprenyl-3-methyl-5-hydroxy-6-metoxy-1,4-benzoquinol methylase
MLSTQQQNESLGFFNKAAADWKKRAASAGSDSVNVIQQRNGVALHVMKNRSITRSTLDVGCGTGELVCDIARKNIPAEGIDFAAEMIALAKEAAEKQSLTLAKFHALSVFDFAWAGKQFDLISANGFVEYISFSELHRFLDLAKGALAKEGSLVVGSRNRLFNLFSLNSFTTREIQGNSVLPLLKEAVALASGASVADLLAMETPPLQEENISLSKTADVDVSTRYQFTPAQMLQLLKKKGLEPVEIFPIHVHGVLPQFKALYPSVHTGVANLLHQYQTNAPGLLLPHASSFIVHAKRV